MTFTELMKECERIGFDVQGDLMIFFGEMPNVIFWADVNEPFVEAFDLLRFSKRVVPAPASWLAYLFEGGMLRLPIAKRIPKRGYKKPHWLPIVFWTVEEDAEMQRRGLSG